MTDVRSFSVLLVEDNPGDARLLYEMLAESGESEPRPFAFFLAHVPTIAEAVDALATASFDVVLLDLSLPDSQGLDSLHRILNAAPDAPILVLSGASDETLAVQAVQEGAQDYYVKDQVSGPLLRRAIRYAIERKRLVHMLQRNVQAGRSFSERLATLLQVTNELSQAPALDDLCRLAVERGRSHLGFDRLGLWLVDQERDILQGTFGIDQQGRLRDERSQCHSLSERVLAAHYPLVEILARRELLVRREDVLFHDTDNREIGRATHLLAALWDGAEIAGFLSMDNLLARQPVSEEDGRLLSLYASAVGHLFALKRRDEALRRSERYFRSLIEHAPDIITILDADGVVRYESPALERVMGYRPEDVIGNNVEGSLHPDDAGLLQETLAELVREPGATRAAEIRLRHLDGTWRQLEVVVANHLQDPDVGGFVVNSRDVTERRQRERELEAIAAASAALRDARTRAEMLPILLEQVLDLLEAEGASVAEMDPATGEAVIEWALGNAAPYAGLRLPPETGLTGRVLASGRPLVSPDVTGEPGYAGPEPHGSKRPAACVPLIAQGEVMGALWAGRSRPFRDDELRLLAAIADIAASAIRRADVLASLEERVAVRTTELAQANVRLMELDRLKSKFVADVSHELRTPVTNLSLYLNLLQRGKPEKREQYLATLNSEVTRLGHLIEDIVDISRLDRGEGKENMAEVDLNIVAEVATVAHEPQAQAVGLDLSLELASGLAPIWGDAAQLVQVATNLVANALHYTPEGRVQVSTGAADDGGAWLAVTDTGLGIAAEDRPHLFQRFYRGLGAGQLGVPGSGLGLAIAAEIVSRHGGRIEMESRPGLGSTFTVRLPPRPNETETTSIGTGLKPVPIS